MEQWLICGSCLQFSKRNPDDENLYHSCWNHLPKTGKKSVLRLPTREEINREIRDQNLTIRSCKRFVSQLLDQRAA